MMDSVCPLAFRHKKGEYFVEFLLSRGVLFIFLSGGVLFILELVEFRLYLGASLCTLHF